MNKRRTNRRKSTTNRTKIVAQVEQTLDETNFSENNTGNEAPQTSSVEKTDLQAKIEAIRKKRKPLNTRDRLTAPARPGYIRRFVNDLNDGRIARFEEAGWEVVQSKQTLHSDIKKERASQLGSPDMRPVGSGTNTVLMEIPEEIYNEDQKRKQDAIKEAEDQRINNPSVDGNYGKIEVTVTK